MRFKRITALVLLMIFAISVMPAIANEEASLVSAEAYEKNVDFVTSLGIYSFSEEKADSVVTRAQFAKMITDLLGISGDYSASDYFTDIPANNPYIGAVGAVASLGIMNGVGEKEFRPDDGVTYTQAVKTIVTALGYDPMAKAAGGYPNGYMKSAYNIGIIKNAPYDFNAPITFSAAANLIALSSEAEVYDMVYLTAKKAYYASKQGRVVLNVYHDIYLAEGRMTDNGISSLSGNSTIADNCVKIGERVFIAKNERIRDFLGYYVDYYYRETDDALLYVMAKKNRNDVVIINAKDLSVDSTDFSKTCLVAKVNGRRKEYKLDQYSDLIYNGGLDKTFNKETLKIKGGTIKLINADNDNDYEVIMVEEYRDIIFKNCNISAKKLSANYAEEGYAFIDYGEYKAAVFQNASGEEIAPESIKENSIVSVFKSKNKEKIRFVVTEMAIEIVANSVETDEDGEIKVSFGENTYTFSDTYKTLVKTKPDTFKAPEASFSYKIFLNYEGDIAMMIKTRGRLSYAYLLAAARPKNNGLESGRVDVKLVLDSNDVVTVPVSDKLIFDGEKNKSGSDILSSKVIFDSATGKIKPQLVMVRISPDGKLKELDTAVDNRNSAFGFDLENFSLDFVSESSLGSNSINGVRTYSGHQATNANTKVFVVKNMTKTMEETDEDLVSVIDYATYTRRYGSSYIKMYDADEAWNVSAIVVSDVIDYQSRLFVVTESFMQKDYDGEFKQTINGWWAQDYRSFVEVSDGILSNAVKSRYPGSDGVIYPGDVLEICFDYEEKINRARMVYSPMRDTDPDYCFFDMSGQSSDIYYILGYPCYISKDRIGTFSKANPDYVTVSGSNAATVDRFWTTILQATTGSMSVFEFDCETKELKTISWEKIPTSGQLTSKGYENFNPDTKVLVKHTKGTTYDVVVVTNLSANYK